MIGCGNISGIYLENLTNLFSNTELAACADLIAERAREAAQSYNVPRACSVEELLADPDIELVLNLTIPKAHAEVCLSALEAGKHVYTEKPLAIERKHGREVLEAAQASGLLVGGAPDTFLGGGIRTCRKLIDEGIIGETLSAAAFMTTPGHERWHPDPEFYYQKGGGPVLDMGPYYLSALVYLMGPIKRVTCFARASYPERTITSEPKCGQRIPVEVSTHMSGALEFASGALGTIMMSFDVWGANLPFIEVYGSEGSLSVPDPNTFDGPVRLLEKNQEEWREIPLAFGYTDNSRGLGVADMADAIVSGRKPRAGIDLTFHVLDIMEGLEDSVRSGSCFTASSSCERPAAGLFGE
jgi:predicted dehydrogenase